LSIHSGWRYEHEKFCIISDRPEILKTELRNGVYVAHSEEGPSHRWSDGWSLWHINGVRVDSQIVMAPETQTLAQLDGETNNDVQAIRIARYGWPRYLAESGCTVYHARNHPRDELPEKLYIDKSGRKRFVVIDPSTSKPVTMLVPREVETCEQAQAFISHGLDRFSLCRT
jgi:hypothetical protein